MARRFYPPTESDIPMHGWRPYSDMHRERIRAHAKHDDGHGPHPYGGHSMERKPYQDPDWMDVITEELGEVARCHNELRHGNLTVAGHKDQLRSELIQLGAMVAAYVDAIDLEHCGPCCAIHDPGHTGPHVDWTGYKWRLASEHPEETVDVVVGDHEDPRTLLDAYDIERGASD